MISEVPLKCLTTFFCGIKKGVKFPHARKSQMRIIQSSFNKGWEDFLTRGMARNLQTKIFLTLLMCAPRVKWLSRVIPTLNVLLLHPTPTHSIIDGPSICRFIWKRSIWFFNVSLKILKLYFTCSIFSFFFVFSSKINRPEVGIWTGVFFFLNSFFI